MMTQRARDACRPAPHRTTRGGSQLQLVQVTLTDELAGLLAASAGIAVSAHEQDVLVSLTDDELTEYKRLAVFMTAVASEPAKFPVRESLARSIKSKVRATRGPAQKQSRRKVRSQSQQKRDRVQRRREVAEHNQATAAYEKDRIDHEAFITERTMQTENEPKFNITDIAGNVILAGVPESMVVRTPTEETTPEAVQEFFEQAARPGVYVPGQRPDAEA